jgi:type I restriction enzyme M protein
MGFVYYQDQATAKTKAGVVAWEILARYRTLFNETGWHSSEAMLVYTAALLFLRWVDFYETEERAISELEGLKHDSVLIDRQCWLNFRDLHPQDLSTLLKERFSSLIRDSSRPLDVQLRAVEYALQQVEVPPLAAVDEYILFLFECIDALPFATEEDRAEASRVLDVLLASNPDSRQTGEYITPQPIVDLMIELVDPKPGERIYDPCFGMGGLLVASTRRLQEKAKFLSPRSWLEVQDASIYGIEINRIAYAIGLTRVILAGIHHPRLVFGDALERPMSLGHSEGYDCILAVPPWGGKIDLYAYRSGFMFPTSNKEGLFLQHIMNSLCPGGRAVVALPDGVLFRTGAEKQIREHLLTEYQVEGVLGLPPGAFTPFTGINSSLLVIRRAEPTGSVRFFNVEDFPTSKLKHPSAQERQIKVQQIVKTFRSGKLGTHLWETSIERLAKRDWELIVKRTGDEAVAAQLKTLVETDPSIQVRSLQTVADVFSGITYKKDIITKNPKQSNVINGLLRVSDVKEALVQAPELFLTEAGISKVKDKHYIKPNDIVLTKSGTIGKVGRITETKVLPAGTIATQGIAVIRPKEGISSDFLASILRSPTYQAWLKGHARGATIQYLSMEALKNLKVPVPSIQIQNRICRGGISDALSALLRMLTGGDDDSLLTWLEQSKVVRSIAKAEQSGSQERLHWLDQWGRELYRLGNFLLHSEEELSNGIRPWVIQAINAARVLQGVDQIPNGTGGLAVLEYALREILTAQSQLPEKSLAVIERAKSVSNDVAKLLQREIKSILDTVEIKARLEPSAVVAGTPNEVSLIIRNTSSVAIRQVKISTTPNLGQGQALYLSENGEIKIPLLVEPQQAFGTFDFAMAWLCDRLDGTPVQGDISLTLAIQSTRERAFNEEIGTSPYIVGSPVDLEEMFFGREDVIESIQAQLSTSKRANVILLEGNRRTGKTSILKQLQRPEVLPGWVTVDCSFQGAEGNDSEVGMRTQDVFRLIARKIAWACHNVGIDVWLPGQEKPVDGKPFKIQLLRGLNQTFSNGHPFEIFELYLQSVLEAIQPSRLLLMLDEFDKLQEGIDSGVTSPQVPENIRYLLHEYPNLSAIITGSRRLKRLREEYWSALFGIGHQIPISALPKEAARNLVTQPVEGKLIYLPEARDRVVEVCASHPFILQSFCNYIFQDAISTGDRTITTPHVEKVMSEMVKDYEHFRTLWGYASTERRRLILALCEQLSGGDDPVNLALLEVKFEEMAVPAPRREGLSTDIEFLRELELIDLDNNNRDSYTLAVPLMGEWIRKNIDCSDLIRKAIIEAEDKV